MKSPLKVHWNLNEFKTYLLLYAVHADFIQSPEEKEMILKIAGAKTYNQILKEFQSDNDYQSLEKIMLHVRHFGLDRAALKELLSEMDRVQRADHESDLLEKVMLMLLKRIFEQECT